MYPAIGPILKLELALSPFEDLEKIAEHLDLQHTVQVLVAS